MSNVEVMYSVYFIKKTEQSLRLVGVLTPAPRRAIPHFDILRFAVKFCVVSYERRRWPKKRPVKSKKRLPSIHSAMINCGSGFQPRFTRSYKHLQLPVSYEISGVRSCEKQWNQRPIRRSEVWRNRDNLFALWRIGVNLSGLIPNLT